MKTGVLLVNWNNDADTEECVRSLFSSVISPDIVLVWNNSDRKTPEINLQKTYNNVIVSGGYGNVGFAEANNRGVEILISHECDYVWILNNDTTVHPSCLQNFISFIEERPDVKIMTNKIMYSDNRNVLWYGGGEISPLTFEATHIGINQETTSVVDKAAPVAFASGCSILIHRSVLISDQLFSPKYIAYCEDLEWCLRMHEAGHIIWYNPAAIIYHKCSSSIRRNNSFKGKVSPLQHYYTIRNRLWTIRKHKAKRIHRLVAVFWYLRKPMYYLTLNALLFRFHKVMMIFRGVVHGVNSHW